MQLYRGNEKYKFKLENNKIHSDNIIDCERKTEKWSIKDRTFQFLQESVVKHILAALRKNGDCAKT